VRLHQCDLRQYDHIQDEEEWFATVLSRYWEPREVESDEDFHWLPEDQPTSTCPQCGATGACGYDQEGRPMIHTNPTLGRTL
jgi:hypothetical protein